LFSSIACSSKPSPYSAFEPFLKAWEEGRYGDMYDLLSSKAQESISREQFIQRYQAITEGSTILAVKPSFVKDEKLEKVDNAVVLPFNVVMSTARLGEISEANLMSLVYEGDRWRVEWSPSLIFKDLSGDNRILFEPEEPLRGSIFDRKGRPLATKGKIVSIGVVPEQIEDEAHLLSSLEQHLGISPDVAKAAYQNAQPDWFVPLLDLAVQDAEALRSKLEEVPGMLFREKAARVYPHGSTAAHIVGYLGRITADEYETLKLKGYSEDDLIGRAGIEAWGESVLAGEKGGKLSVVTPDGQLVKVIAHKAAKDGKDIYLTIDLDLQKLAEESLGPQGGSVVMMDVQSNGILAMASYPRFDPNKFITGFSDAEWKQLNEDELHPFQNRPLSSAYPVGSVFKVITMSAGLEKGGFTPSSAFDCNGRWQVPGSNIVMGDWLPQGHGHLDLYQGLVQSCNIVFYEIAKKMHSIDPDLIPEFARGFGFGQPTGLNALSEVAGVVPDPAWKQANQGGDWYIGDSANLAIGQGFFLATPLQVVNAYAAIARGGALQTPILVAKRGDESFQSQPKGKLPVSPANLEVIRRAMRDVVSDPNGTAVYAFRGSGISLAAKTGSAEAGGPNSHAWFASYAPYENPQIAMVVMVEEKGHGSEYAAPVARKILDQMFR
ncbi:MAG: penicillin-binding protein 2, partial [Chloroflexota bacterium]